MESRVRDLLRQITALEEQLQTVLQERERPILFHIQGKRVEFEKAVRAKHRRLKMGITRWIATSRPQNFLTAPFIYGMIVPLVFVDLCLTIYQAVCFPIYQIPKVKRSNYIVIDRYHLGYLNVIERFHCTYCSYANGLLAYAREITARTEQYWCPIKHARKVLGAHARYAHFLAYGDATKFHARVEKFRKALAKEKSA